MDQVGFPDDTSSQKTSRRRAWILFFLLALLFHALLFSIHLSLIPPERPAPVEVQEFDLAQLNALRQKWKQNPLVLNQDPGLPREQKAPDNARYDSDRNTSVTREQKSAYSDVLPVPGPIGPASPSSGAKARSQGKPKQATTRTLPSLGNLGIPFHIQDHAVDPPLTDPNEKRLTSETYGSGKGQTLLDDSLSTGAETLLNTRESHYYSFYKRVYDLVAPLWSSKIRGIMSSRPLTPGRYLTEYEVILDQEGNLLEIKFHKLCGEKEFDQAVEAAWQKIGKFHNPPRGLIEEDHLVHIRQTSTVEVYNQDYRNRADYLR